jgi:general secretion pathway protein J
MNLVLSAPYCIGLRNLRSKQAAGFTLVEVVVALAVMSLLMITVLAALRTFGNTQGSLDEVARRIDEVRAVSSFMRDALEATVPNSADSSGLGFGGGGGDSLEESSFFEGDTNGFQWKVRMIFGEAYGGTFLARVEHKDDALILQWQRPPVPVESATWGDELSRVLVNQLQELKISYRGESGTPWREQWQEAVSPELVRLNIKSRDRYWPELIMSVQQ